MIASHRWVVAPIGAALLFLAVAVAVMAQPAPPGDHLAAGLNHPRGLSLDGNDVLVSVLGTGEVLRIAPDGTVTTAASGLPSGTIEIEGDIEPAGPAAAIAVGGGYMVAISEADGPPFSSVFFSDGANSTLVADLGEYEAANNTDGGTTIEGDPELLSNPYDILSDGQGGFFVSDAGANAVLHIDADGAISPYAIFFDRDNPLFPNIGGPQMDQVPTGMAIGPDGALYVATLTGFPFPQGEARIYRVVDLNGNGNALDAGEVTVYATGLSTVTDIAFDNNGDLLAVQFSANILAEAPGQLVRVTSSGNEILVDGLITPTSVLVTQAGRIIVSQEFAGLVSDVTDAIGAAPAPPPAGEPAAPAPAPAPAPADTGQGMGATGSTGTLPLAVAMIAALALLATRRLTARGTR